MNQLRFSRPLSVQQRFALSTTLLLSLCISDPRLAAQAAAQQPRPAIIISGNIRDASGVPVADAALSLKENGSSAYVSATTKSDGAFSFLVLRPGSYTLRAEKKGIPPAIVSVLVGEGEKKRFDLVLGRPQANSDSTAESPNAENSKAAPESSKVPKDSASANMELTDKPSFTVAGVTDYTNVGGHGSDTKLRTSESLARETAALKLAEPAGTGTSAADSAKSAVSTPETAREAESHRLAGDSAEKSGDLLAAEREYETAVRLGPSEQNYFAWGTELLLHRATRPAAEVFTKGANLHPTSARMLAGLGAALYANGAYAEAARRLCAASDLQPAEPAPYLFLGKMEKAAPDPLPCAAERLARFAHDQPKNPQAKYYFALSLWKRAQRDESAQYIARTGSLAQAAITIDPKFAEAYVLLGMVYGARIDFPEAIEAYKKAIEINPLLAEAHYRLAQAYKRVGDEVNSEKETQLYKEAAKAESDALDRQRREIRQFLIILKDPAQASPAEQPEKPRE